MSRYFIQLSYLGTKYHGWQVQPNGVTVQELINKTFATILRENINVTGAGRTDTGVHASYFIAHFDSEKKNLHENKKLIYNLNSILPGDIAIQRIYLVKNNNHARFDAVSRTYKYYISRVKNPFRMDTSYLFTQSLNICKMNDACKELLKYENFTSFSKLHTHVKTNDCKIYSATWEDKENLLIFTIKANRFLRNMVRSIVGTMIDIGVEKTDIDRLRKIIEKKDRALAGMSAPAHGLFLTDIEYPYTLG